MALAINFEVQKCLLDMDGVLVDFVAGACQLHNLPNPYENPENHGIWDIATVANVPDQNHFWNSMGLTFWANLPKMHDCDAIVETLEEHFGKENICILSSPTKHKDCMAGKLHWLEKNLKKYSRQFLFGKRKEFCANPNHVLIDDYDENVSMFRSHGGKAILIPRPWNALHASTIPVIDHLWLGLQSR